jgi:hypothetical protein
MNNGLLPRAASPTADVLDAFHRVIVEDEPESISVVSIDEKSDLLLFIPVVNAGSSRRHLAEITVEVLRAGFDAE